MQHLQSFPFKLNLLSLVKQSKSKTPLLMKIILPISLLFIPLFFFAQSNKIESLKEELKTLDSIKFIEKAIILSDEYYKQGKYQGASGAATHAYRVAKEIDTKEGMAIALNREGKAMLRQKKRKGTRADIALKFMDSNDLLDQAKSTNDALRVNNLKHLKKIAQQLNRTKDFNDLEKQIRDLQASSKNGLTKDTLKAIGDILKCRSNQTQLPPT